MRAIAVVLLTIWHCFFCTMFVWGIVPFHKDIIPYKFISSFFIVDAVMPLFTFLSGYLFTALWKDHGKYRDFVPFLKNKLNRLLVPFLIFSILIISTSYNLEITDIVWGEGSHMWYCVMLFWCFLIDWTIKKFGKRKIGWALFVFSSTLVLAYKNFWYLPFKLPLGFDNSLYYYSFFFIGGIVFNHRKILLDFFSDKVIFVLGVYIIIYIVNILNIHILSRIAIFLQSYLFLFTLWLIIMLLIQGGMLSYNRKLERLCKCSFGIYVFHHWIAWNVVWYPPASEFLRNHYLLFPLLLTPIVFFASYALTDLLLKTRIGNYLLS